VGGHHPSVGGHRLWVGDGRSWVVEMVICGWGMVVVSGDGIVIRRHDVERAKE